MKPNVVGRAWIAVVSLAWGSVACASLQPPAVQVVQVRLSSLGVSGGEVSVGLDVANPNSREVVLRRVRYSLEVAGGSGDPEWVELGEASHDEKIVLPALDTARVDVLLPFTYGGIGTAVGALLREGEIQYRGRGSVVVDGFLGGFEVPFSSTGTIRPL